MSYFRIALRNVRRNRWRSFLLILGITLSVALETGIAISVDSLYENFINDYRRNNYTDITIHSTLNSTTVEEMREIAATIQTIEGIINVSTIVSYVMPSEELETVIEGYNSTNNLILYGCDASHPDFDYIELVKGNRSLNREEILISNHLADRLGVSIGQYVNLTPIIPIPLYINGIMKDVTNFGNLFGYFYILANIDFFTEVFLENEWDFNIECVVKIKNLIKIDEIIVKIKEILGHNFLVFKEKIISDLSKYGIVAYQAAMNIILLASYIVAILFLTNILAINVNERKKEFGILKSVGISNFQTIRMLCIEILIYSIIGSFLGIVVGVFFSLIYLTLFNRIEQTITVSILILKSESISSAFITGIFVSLIAGIYPLLLAISLPPVQSIHYQQRRLDFNRRTMWKYSFITGFLLIIIGFFGTLFIGPSQFLSFEILSIHFLVIVLILIGTLLILAGFLTFLPHLGEYLFWFPSVSRVISSRNIKRELPKSLITILTSATALSFILIIGLISNALIAAVPKFYNDQFGSIDIIAECYDGEELPITLVDNLTNNDEIIKASFIQEKKQPNINSQIRQLSIFGIDPVKYEEFMDPILAQTKPNIAEMMDPLENGVIMSNLFMRNFNIGLNSKFHVFINNTTSVELTVNGIVRSNPFIRGGLYIFISSDLFNNIFPPDGGQVAKWFVMSIGDNDPNKLVDSLVQSYEEFYQVISVDYYSNLIEGSLERQSILFQVLYLESFFLAGLAQFVCILISTLKMERELGIMRGMGLSKREVFATFLAESTLLGVTAVIIGILEGVIGTYLMAWYISTSIPIAITPDPLLIAFWVIISLIITFLSTSIPSYRSSNRSIVAVITGRDFREIKIRDEDRPTTELLYIENLKGYYRGYFGIVHGVDNVSFSVERGEIIGLAGESGCGKSTLAELITGTPRPLLHYESGKVIVDKYEIYRMSPELLRTEVKCKIMSYVPQASMESLNPVKKIKDFIMDTVRERTGEKGSKKEVYELAEKHFERVGLEKNVLNRYPYELSGGMKQRVVIAISTLWNPNLLIIDEPTSALDVTSQKQMIQMLSDLKNSKIIQSIIFISHDIATLRQLCGRCIIMYCGEIVETGTIDDIINNPLHPYTSGLVSSIISFNPDGSRPTTLKSIPGKQPDLRKPPNGCRFHPRCSKTMSKCQYDDPPVFKYPDKNQKVKCWLFE